jgi:hypothetical protein
MINHHPDLSEASNRRLKLRAIIEFIFTLFRIILYHSVSILAVWFSRQYGSGLVRGSGILLIGEFLHEMASVIQQMFYTHHLPAGELYFIGIFYLLLLLSVLITFRLVEKLSKYEQCSKHLELLANTAPKLPIDNSVPSTTM